MQTDVANICLSWCILYSYSYKEYKESCVLVKKHIKKNSDQRKREGNAVKAHTMHELYHENVSIINDVIWIST